MSTAPTQQRPGRRWIFFTAVSAVVVCVAGIAFVAWRARHLEEYTRRWIVNELSSFYGSQVDLGRLRVTLWPRVSVTGENLAIAGRAASPMAPPLIHIDRFVFHLSLREALDVPHRIPSVRVENMTITIPAHGGKLGPKSPVAQEDLPNLVVDEIACRNTVLVITPGDPKKEPLEWDIHDLVLHRVSPQHTFHFAGTLTNAKPVGEIATEGDFGPWVLDEPGTTRVSGAYNFQNADLGPFPGIAGILSSKGIYAGPLNRLEVQGETDTPDFSLDKVGIPVPLHTEYSATVDGTTGDTFLHPVRATLGKSLLIAEGKVARELGKPGHLISLSVSGANASIQDLLKLAVKSEEPVLAGPAKIKAKLTLPPGKQKVIERMILDGQVGVADARWSSPVIRDKLESLSRHAEGKPSDVDAGSSVSDLKGKFHLEQGEIHFSSLAFSVPGAAFDLTGQYGMQSGEIDFRGHLRMQAKLSQTVTGAKSFFLKALDPFFKKDGAGAELPIRIAGTRETPTISVLGFRKTVKTADSAEKPEDPQKKEEKKDEKKQ